MARKIAAIAAGTVAGLAIFAVWMRNGADPKQDPLLSPLVRNIPMSHVKWRAR